MLEETCEICADRLRVADAAQLLVLTRVEADGRIWRTVTSGDAVAHRCAVTEAHDAD